MKSRPRTARSWALVQRRKQTHWAEQYSKLGPSAALRAAEDLHAHMRSIRPSWPEPELRRQDLEQHIKLRSLFDRAAHGLASHARRHSAR